MPTLLVCIACIILGLAISREGVENGAVELHQEADWSDRDSYFTPETFEGPYSLDSEEMRHLKGGRGGGGRGRSGRRSRGYYGGGSGGSCTSDDCEMPLYAIILVPTLTVVILGTIAIALNWDKIERCSKKFCSCCPCYKNQAVEWPPRRQVSMRRQASMRRQKTFKDGNDDAVPNVIYTDNVPPPEL